MSRKFEIFFESINFQEEDATLSAEDLQKKIERLTKLAKKKSEDHTFVNNTLRATDLGQDRYRFAKNFFCI